MLKANNKILTEDISQGSGIKLSMRVEKFSGLGLTFHERVLYADEQEIRYYSKIPKNFKPDNIKKLKDVPKTGVPTALCELDYPPVKWLTKKDKKYAVKLIFPQGSQMFYKIKDNQLQYLDNQKNEMDIQNHISSIKSMVIRKKVEWVFVFRTALDLQKFVRLVESVTNPDYGLNLENIPLPQPGGIKGGQSTQKAAHI